MKGILDAGFVFWGLFLVFGVIVALYLVWMRWVEGPGEPPVQQTRDEEAP